MLSQEVDAMEDLQAGKGKNHHQGDCSLPHVPRLGSTEQSDNRLNYIHAQTDIVFNVSRLWRVVFHFSSFITKSGHPHTGLGFGIESSLP